MESDATESGVSPPAKEKSHADIKVQKADEMAPGKGWEGEERAERAERAEESSVVWSFRSKQTRSTSA